MSLADEIFEWRKQFVEKLLLNGAKPEDMKKQLDTASALIYGNYIGTMTIECPLRLIRDLEATLLEFSQKNGCLVIAKTSS